ATGTDPLVAVPGGALSLGNETLMVVTGGATATIAAPLLSATSATLTSSATMMVIVNGTLTANLSSGASLLNLNSIFNTDPGLPEAINVGPGGTLTVGSLVDAANSTLTVSAGNLLCAGCLCPACGSPSMVIVNGSMLRLNGGVTVTTNGGAANGNFHGALISAADASLVLVTG